MIKNRQNFVVNKIEQSLTKSGSSANKAFAIKTNFMIYGKPDVKNERKQKLNKANQIKEKNL